MALGASRSSVLTMVLGGALRQILVGLGLGIPAALLAGHLMASQLYGVGGYDPLALISATLVLGLCATIGPRATRRFDRTDAGATRGVG